MGEKRRFSSIIHKEENWYVSYCPELDISSQGKTPEEATKNLEEAIDFYLDNDSGAIPNTPGNQTVRLEETLDIPHSLRTGLEKAGFYIVARKGNHIKLRKENPKQTDVVIVPLYTEIPAGNIKNIIRQAGLTTRDFIKLL